MDDSGRIPVRVLLPWCRQPDGWETLSVVLMSQSSIIAAALVIAFLVFVTVRGELPAYFAIFTGTAPTSTPPVGTTPGTGAGGVVRNPVGGRITNPNEWTINPETGEIWTPTGSFLPSIPNDNFFAGPTYPVAGGPSWNGLPELPDVWGD